MTQSISNVNKGCGKKLLRSIDHMVFHFHCGKKRKFPNMKVYCFLCDECSQSHPLASGDKE